MALGGDDGPLIFPWIHGELGGLAFAAVWLKRLEFDVFFGGNFRTSMTQKS